MGSTSPSSSSSLGRTPNSSPDRKSVTGTIRVRESWKAWFCARLISVFIGGLHPGAGRSRSIASVSVRNRSRSPRRQSRVAARLRSGPRSGLIDGDPGLDQEAIHQEREWNASMSPASSFKDFSRSEHTAAHHTLVVRPHRSGSSSPSMQAYDEEGAARSKQQ